MVRVRDNPVMLMRALFLPIFFHYFNVILSHVLLFEVSDLIPDSDLFTSLMNGVSHFCFPHSELPNPLFGTTQRLQTFCFVHTKLN